MCRSYILKELWLQVCLQQFRQASRQGARGSKTGPHSPPSLDHLLGLLIEQTQLEARRQGNPLCDLHASIFQSRGR